MITIYDNLHVGSIFHNENGEDYTILAINRKRDEALLGYYCPKSNTSQYIVAWGSRPHSWAQGHYFMDNFKSACEYFNREEG